MSCSRGECGSARASNMAPVQTDRRSELIAQTIFSAPIFEYRFCRCLLCASVRVGRRWKRSPEGHNQLFWRSNDACRLTRAAFCFAAQRSKIRFDRVFVWQEGNGLPRFSGRTVARPWSPLSRPGPPPRPPSRAPPRAPAARGGSSSARHSTQHPPPPLLFSRHV